MKKNTTYCWRLVDIDPDPNGNPVGDPNHIYFFKTGDPDPNIIPTDVNDRIFDANTVIRLERPYNVSDFNDTTGVVTTDADWLIVDKVDVPKWLVDHNDPNSDPNYTVPNGVTRSYSRALHWGHILQRVWDVNGVTAGRYPSLGDWNNFNVSDPNYLWTWPRNYNFDNVGDVALMLKKPVYFLSGDDPCQAVGYTANNRREENVRIDLTDPNMQRIFNYIAVLDPAINISDPNYQNVTTVYGRLNINTAPARVLSKLPWVANRGKSTTGWTTTKNELAEAIVAYREKLKLNADVDYTSRSALKGGREEGTGIGPQLREEPGFASIAEIAMVTNPGNSSAARDYSMWWYALEQTGDQPGYPDLTNWYWRERGDGIADDFEERYLIFSRISDICTVRSDVFTAYILVRLGQDGPQRRMIAIFDRSEVGRDAMTGQWGGKVKLLALQPVPEVR
ncbi:MAG: hypothetical protein A2Y07_00365 [Planctomycetes bacterium GWF2_50_10]|nr:MAG: hypothetical protein A2Y07_00365 [Planctomycetes bacterium GWF2_50_10]